MCPCISSASWHPYEWMSEVHGVLSSEVLLSSCRLMAGFFSWSQSISYSVFLFSCCLLLFPALLPFPNNPGFSWCLQSRTVSVLSLLSPEMFQAQIALGPTCSSFWWSRISTEISSSTVLQMNQYFFLSVFFSVIYHLCILLSSSLLVNTFWWGVPVSTSFSFSIFHTS